MTTSTPNSISSSNAEAESRPGFLGRRPWLFVVAAFCLLFTAWGLLFYVAYSHLPASVPLSHETPARSPR